MLLADDKGHKEDKHRHQHKKDKKKDYNKEIKNKPSPSPTRLANLKVIRHMGTLHPKPVQLVLPARPSLLHDLAHHLLSVILHLQPINTASLTGMWTTKPCFQEVICLNLILVPMTKESCSLSSIKKLMSRCCIRKLSSHCIASWDGLTFPSLTLPMARTGNVLAIHGKKRTPSVLRRFLLHCPQMTHCVAVGRQLTVQNPDELYVLVSSALPTTHCDMTCTVLKAT